jgi:hypothetical protein
MPSYLLKGLGSGSRVFLSSTGHAQSLQAPGKALQSAGHLRRPSRNRRRWAGGFRPYSGSGSYGDGTTAAFPGGHVVGRPNVNSGGLSGPRSGLAVRPGLGVGGLGPGF